MARKSNSKEATDAIRADIQSAIDERVKDYVRYMEIEPTAFDLWQVMKFEMAEEYVCHGAAACFKCHLNCMDGVFMDEFSVEDMRNTVARWLDQTPEEVGKYRPDTVESLYKSLVLREFNNMVEQSRPSAGHYVEAEPVKTPSNPHASINVKLRFVDGAGVDNVMGSHCFGAAADARVVYDFLKTVIASDRPYKYLDPLSTPNMKYDLSSLVDAARLSRWAVEDIDAAARGDMSAHAFNERVAEFGRESSMWLSENVANTMNIYLNDYLDRRMQDPESILRRTGKPGVDIRTERFGNREPYAEARISHQESAEPGFEYNVQLLHEGPEGDLVYSGEGRYCGTRGEALNFAEKNAVKVVELGASKPKPDKSVPGPKAAKPAVPAADARAASAQAQARPTTRQAPTQGRVK